MRIIKQNSKRPRRRIITDYEKYEKFIEYERKISSDEKD